MLSINFHHSPVIRLYTSNYYSYYNRNLIPQFQRLTIKQYQYYYHNHHSIINQYPYPTKIQHFSTSITPKSTETRRSRNWRYLAKIIKYSRIPALVLSVYGLGYTAGIAEYARSPKEMKNNLFRGVLQGVGCDSLDKVNITYEGQWKTIMTTKKLSSLAKATTNETNSESKHNNDIGYGPNANRNIQLMNIAYVSEKLLHTAKKLVAEHINQVHVVNDKGEIIPTHEEEFKKWYKAYQSLDSEGEKWKFVLIDVPLANAFVSETTPYTIYVTTAMLDKIVSNDDELALILGHELSHLLLSHSLDSVTLETYLRAVEVLFLSIDPTEGILSLFIMASLQYIRNILSASHSRHHENEADELGIKLAAMSCFDTKRAPKVFAKMHEHNKDMMKKMKGNDEVLIENVEKASQKDGYLLNSYMDTHPPTLLRYENLVNLSKEENPDKYPSNCINVRRKLLKALKLGAQ